MSAALAAAFDAAMARLGRFGDTPILAVGVSGGADSLALALLAHEWARRHSGSILGLIVDHGLRPESAGESLAVAGLLAERGAASRIIPLSLPAGAALQERARRARHEALARAARAAGAAHLLLGHHWRDQAETAAMRAARGDRGMAGMAAVIAGFDVLVIRPLLHVEPALLRDFLREAGCGWTEDPSNADRRFERARVRAQEPAVERIDVCDAGHVRREEMRETARRLARDAEIRPQGYALWRGDGIPPDTLANLLRAIGGGAYPPDRRAVLRLAERLRPATLGGVQAARWRDAWLFAREPAACAPRAALRPGQSWDGRFRLVSAPKGAPPGACEIGPLARNAAKFRRLSDLPSLVLQTLPAVYDCDTIIAVPHLVYGAACGVAFCPPGPVAPIPFVLHPFVFEASSSEGAGA